MMFCFNQSPSEQSNICLQLFDFVAGAGNAEAPFQYPPSRHIFLFIGCLCSLFFFFVERRLMNMFIN